MTPVSFRHCCSFFNLGSQRVIYLPGFSEESQKGMTGRFVVVVVVVTMTFPRISFSESVSPFKWPQNPQDFYWTWAGQDSGAEALLIILNYRCFKIKFS